MYRAILGKSYLLPQRIFGKVMLTRELLLSRMTDEYILKNAAVRRVNLSSKRRIAILGYSRCGKDTIAQYLTRCYGYRFDGPCSLFLCNLIYPENTSELYVTRHQYRQILFDFGNMVRALNPNYVGTNVLECSDIMCGLRSWPDLEAMLSAGHIQEVVWIHRTLTAPDPTFDFDVNRVIERVPNHFWFLNNVDGNVTYLYDQVDAMMKALGQKREFGKVDCSFKRYGTDYGNN